MDKSIKIDIDILKISGVDAKKLLQGQLTCDLNQLTDMNSLWGALCNPQGRVISFFSIILRQDTYYLLMPTDMAGITLNALKKFAVFYKVMLEDASSSMFVIASSKVNDVTHSSAALMICPITLNRFLILGDKENEKEALAVNQANLLTPAQWKYANISENIPAIYPETSGQFLPHEINLKEIGAISFNKGCYTGQEIIARMEYRGKLKKHLYQAIIIHDSLPTPGADVFAKTTDTADVVGSIIDSTPQPGEKDAYRVLILIDEINAKDHHLMMDPSTKQHFKLV